MTTTTQNKAALLDELRAAFTAKGATPTTIDADQHRYGLKSKALAEVNRDMEVYLARKFGEAAQKSFSVAA